MEQEIKNKAPLHEMNRKHLWELLPLEAPMSVTIEPSGLCNFRCKYCAQALGNKFDTRHFKREIMPMPLFKDIVGQLKEFGTIKKIHLFRNGEPLINPSIAEMVALLKTECICETINISTNAALLTPELSNKLIDAGLDEQIYQNLKYFYNHRKQCRLYIKIIDMALNSEKEKEEFYQLFSPIADRVYVETAVPVYESIDYSKMLHKENTTRAGREVEEPLICHLAFYHLHILANGDVVPCNSIEFPIKKYNVKEKSLKEIWNSQERLVFLYNMLLGNRKKNDICKKCKRLCQEYQPEDKLDGYEEDIIKRFEKRYSNIIGDIL